MIQPGSTLTLEIEKPAAGGRMLARHQGQVVLVWNAIPGERVTARVERTGKGVLYAETADVLNPSPDRRPAADWRCGGTVYAHIAYPRQQALKAEIVRDAFGRIGRVPLEHAPDVVAGDEAGYRMRARLHVRGGRIGFFREGTHDLCDPEPTRQLLPSTIAWIRDVEAALGNERGIEAIELAENVAGDRRACYVDLRADADAAGIAAKTTALGGERRISDQIDVGGAALTLRRDARAFFQGNRFLLTPLVRLVAGLVHGGPVVDLYAGVGLFGLSLAAAGARQVTLVEGDPISGVDLRDNAAPFDRVRVERRSVEDFLSRSRAAADRPTFIVDPPRTGMSKAAIAGIIRARPARIVYVSCDVATLARDTRALIDAGYEFGGVTAVDLFPNTAHVEAVALFIDER